MYQKRILPYTLFPNYLPQADSRLEHYGQTVCLAVYFITPCSLSSFLPTERVGPYPQAQLYWAGQTVG
jgi:hypothetical protein